MSVITHELHHIPTDIETHLDLSMIKLKLQDHEGGPGWSSAQCESIELEYKRVLALKRLYPDVDIVPNKLVDTFWHHHILDTRSYAADCNMIFGEYLHHDPYFGTKGEDDLNNLKQAFEKTKLLYNSHFRTNFTDNSTRCRTACKPQKCK